MCWLAFALLFSDAVGGHHFSQIWWGVMIRRLGVSGARRAAS
jgi:hypothetical protein